MPHACGSKGGGGAPHLRINDACLRNRDAQRRAHVANGVVATLLVHYKADVPPRRGDAEQVRRGHKRGRLIASAATIIMMFMIPSLLQLVGVFDENVLKKIRTVVVVVAVVLATCGGSRGGGEGESQPTPGPQQ